MQCSRKKCTRHRIFELLDHWFIHSFPFERVPRVTVCVPCADSYSDCVARVPVALQGHYDDVAAGVTWSCLIEECQIQFVFHLIVMYNMIWIGVQANQIYQHIRDLRKEHWGQGYTRIIPSAPNLAARYPLWSAWCDVFETMSKILGKGRCCRPMVGARPVIPETGHQFFGGNHFTNINWNIWSIDLKYLLWSYLSLWPLISQVCVSFHIGLPRMMLFYMPPVLIKCDLAWYRNTITNISHDSQPLV